MFEPPNRGDVRTQRDAVNCDPLPTFRMVYRPRIRTQTLSFRVHFTSAVDWLTGQNERFMHANARSRSDILFRDRRPLPGRRRQTRYETEGRERARLWRSAFGDRGESFAENVLFVRSTCVLRADVEVFGWGQGDESVTQTGAGNARFSPVVYNSCFSLSLSLSPPRRRRQRANWSSTAGAWTNSLRHATIRPAPGTNAKEIRRPYRRIPVVATIVSPRQQPFARTEPTRSRRWSRSFASRSSRPRIAVGGHVTRTTR